MVFDVRIRMRDFIKIRNLEFVIDYKMHAVDNTLMRRIRCEDVSRMVLQAFKRFDHCRLRGRLREAWVFVSVAWEKTLVSSAVAGGPERMKNQS